MSVQALIILLMYFLLLCESVYAAVGNQSHSSRDMSVFYQDGQVIDLHTHLLHLTEVFLLPGDSIKSIQGGDSASWMITVSHEHPGRFFLKAQHKKADSNLLIEGRYHDYWLHVMVDAMEGRPVPYRLRWLLHQALSKEPKLLKRNLQKAYVPQQTDRLYALGEHHLIPDWYFTDKHLSYFHWNNRLPLPVVYASNFKHGPFHMINFRMRGRTLIALEKSPYWRLVSGMHQCAALSTDSVLILKEGSYWHHAHCAEDLS